MSDIEFSAELFFSPVCPMSGHKDPSLSTDIRRAELKMKRSGK